MPMTEKKTAAIRSDLHGRIAQIAGERGRMNPRQLVESIDALRSVADAHGFGAVASLAARLESRLGHDDGSAALLCYLDALDDAVKLDPLRQPAQQALLASVALRLGI